MGRCKNCRFWELVNDWPAGFGKCECPKFKIPIEPIEADDEVIIQDAEFYAFSQLSFGPEFGCVHYEEAKGENTVRDHQD